MAIRRGLHIGLLVLLFTKQIAAQSSSIQTNPTQPSPTPPSPTQFNPDGVTISADEKIKAQSSSTQTNPTQPSPTPPSPTQFNPDGATISADEKIKAAFLLQDLVASVGDDQVSNGSVVDVKEMMSSPSTQMKLNSTFHYLGVFLNNSGLNDALGSLKTHSSVLETKLSSAYYSDVSPYKTQTNIDFSLGDFGITQDERTEMVSILQSFGVSQENQTMTDYLHGNLSLPPDGEVRLNIIFQEIGLRQTYPLQNRMLLFRSGSASEKDSSNGVSDETAASVKAAIDFSAALSDKVKSLEYYNNINRPTLTQRLLKVGKMMDVVSTYIPFMSIAVDLFFTLFETDDFGKLHKRFDEVDQKLDMISDKLDYVLSSIKLDALVKEFNDYEGSISLFYKNEYPKTVTKLQEVTTQRQRDKIAYEYVMKFDQALISEKIFKLNRITAIKQSTLTKNLFVSFVSAEKCDYDKLDNLLIRVLSVFMKGLTAEMAYHNFRGNKVIIIKTLEEARQSILGIYSQYNEQVINCRKNPRTSAYNIIANQLSKSSSTSAYRMRLELERRLPWFGWSIVYYKDDNNFNLYVKRRRWYTLGIGVHQGTEYARGNYATYSISGKKVLISWHDAGKTLQSCCSVTRNQDTIAYFKRPYDISTGSGFLSTGRCSLKYLAFTCFRYDDGSYFTDDKAYFIAADYPTSYEYRSCIRGSYGYSSYSKQKYCICPDFYYGERCEHSYDPYRGKMFLDLQIKLEESFFQTEGIRDVIDVYYEVQEIKDLMNVFEAKIQNSISGLEDAFNKKVDGLQDSMQKGFSKLQSAFIKGYAKQEEFLQQRFTYTNMLSLYGESYLEAHYIAETYHKFLKNEITEDDFGNVMQKVDFAKALFSLESLIIGKDLLLPLDIIEVYRDILIGKDIVPKCMENQARLIVKLQTSLKSLDFYVSKAKLKYIQWKIETQEGGESFLTNVEEEIEKSVGRMEQYSRLWESRLCPKLNVPGINDYCMTNYPYEGLNVSNTIKCLAEDEYPIHSSVPSISCTKNNDTFQWNVVPECKHLSCPALEKQTIPVSVQTGSKANLNCSFENTSNLTGYCVHDEAKAKWLLEPRCVCRESECTNWVKSSSSETEFDYNRECCGKQQTFKCSDETCPVLSLLNLVHDVCTDTYKLSFWEKCSNQYSTIQCLELWANTYYYCNFIVVTDM